ncbi:MAG TPA: histidine--tRNA ligase [Candidatus Lambdaproteobacteria bacterium]|mgnify:FL=1|jgi:histidyl-tRNA synthetase|uniref:Histidine--tRNA ligase n=2 Tax=root TaxID=1 RepID=A0A432GRP3_9DELT|nr:histidine--tRNA ligase [SAR324 cluster bacterium]MCK5900107.1 histidine--tRNA ligase [bacterium]HBJ45769.1 histidine--tRNA ligase [Deltaproteobacteria bacterium]HHZ86610.1 histidine--tRNA ligase [Candidatus Lambdaproteobacteria bacterium]MEC7758780.1 histidine--tRNA ligase [SAR324 cluster bacterium]|tara:strand:- start:4 stop:1278 length:1275 start_codon:yes stop_codon:yes gene_type:complete
MIDLQPVKGTRDFFPDEMRLRNWLFEVWRNVSVQAGFEEYDTCVLEHEELYIRKAGDEISKQLYSFEDKGGRRLSLRPEMTPSLARLVLQHKKSLSFPIKWFSMPQCFRYERMTKGRRREHFQWNADIIGQAEIVAEAEILMLLISACELMGLSAKEIRVFINDRRILNSILSQISVPQEMHSEVLVIMDKRDKISIEALSKLLQDIGMSTTQVDQLNEYLLKSDLIELKKDLNDTQGIDELQNLMDMMETAGFSDYLQFDISIVRGLSYYTGAVFEVNSPAKQHRAICGGGRYDSLLSTYGGEIVPAVGFGFGDVVVLDVLKDLERFPELPRKLDYTIIPFAREQVGTALNIAAILRQQGSTVDCNFSMKKMKKTLQQAGESGAAKAILLFPDELSENKVVIRDLRLHEQNPIKITDLLSSGE